MPMPLHHHHLLHVGTAVAMACSLLTSAASAQSNRQSCTIMVLEDGTMAPGPASRTLSSKNQFGREAHIVIRATNSRYELFVDKPLGFVQSPAGGNNNTRFDVTYFGRGRSEFSEKDAGIPTRIKRGETDVYVDFSAEKLNGAFPGGQYRAGVTVRCE
ncbi:MAG: hypothetical protein AAFO77_05925 [Pseudomonadota bacterium]